MKRILILIIMMCLLTPVLFGQLLTKQEIESVIESRVSLNPEQKEKVVQAVQEILQIIDEEFDAAVEEAVQLHEQEVADITERFTIRYENLLGERDVWRTVVFVEGGVAAIETILLIVSFFAH